MPDFAGVAEEALDAFRTFSDEEPETVDIGIPAVLERVGRLFKGNTVVIGAAQNVGKTSFVQRMLLTSEDKGGIASGEDGEDVWGCRILAEASGVHPVKIRKKDLSPSDIMDLRDARADLQRRSEAGTLPEYRNVIGAGYDQLREAAESLAEAGCKYAILDYLQKFRGLHNERRHEVAGALAFWHKVCTANGMVPIALSQVVRMPSTAEPNPWNLKESGDLENEARMIILLWRDSGDELVMRCKIAKSSFGGGGHRFAYRFSESEQLEPYYGEREEF